MVDPRMALSRLREARPALLALSEDEVLDGLAGALDLWRGPDGLVGSAASALAARHGQSEAMLRYGLERLLASHSRAALAAWVADARAEAGRLLALRRPEQAAPDLHDLRGPEVVAQVLAGNVAALALPAAMEALLARSAVLLKPADGDPVTPVLFKDALDRAAPRLGAAVAVEPWRGGDLAAESVVLGGVDFVVASGGASMIESLSRRLGDARYFYGPRLSVGMVGMAWMEANPTWWEEVAREVALWDQEGCLSPRILFVAGDPERFARRLAPALADWEHRWPTRPRTAEEASAVHAFRAPYEMASPRHAGCLAPDSVAWTVTWDHAPSLAAGPAARVVRVTLRPSPRELEGILTSDRGLLQGIGLEHLGDGDLEWIRLVDRTEIPWRARLSRIQDPPAGWRADGRSGLAELLAAGHSAR